MVTAGPGRPVGLAKTGGRQKGTRNKSTPEKKEQTRAFFHRILDDEIEAKFWRYFMTGYQVIELPDGRSQIIPIPLDPVAWSCFRRAVEYKRGMPVQLVEHANSGDDAFKIEVAFCQPQQ